jgi:hypothetical protein
MLKHKRLTLRRERLRTLVPAQLARVLGGDNTDSFNLGCDSYDCNTTTGTTNTTTTNTTNTTITNTVTDPINVIP